MRHEIGVAWRGSIGDFATDVADLLGRTRVQELVLELKGFLEKNPEKFPQVPLVHQPRTLGEPVTPKKHSHYFKELPSNLVDVYRVLLAFGVTDPCIQHAVKKLLVAGGRGAGKDIGKDVQEAIDSLRRWQDMRAEEAPAAR